MLTLKTKAGDAPPVEGHAHGLLDFHELTKES